MEVTPAKAHRVFTLFRILNPVSVLLWFFYTKGTIGTPVFPWLLALHALVLVGFCYFWYQKDGRTAGKAILIVAGLAVLSLALFYFYGRH